MDKTGSCLCGTVKYSIKEAATETGACHCSMCRKWSGGVFFGVEAKPNTVTFTGEENITRYASSEWGERCFCAKCGSSLYFRIVAPGPHHGEYHFGFGTFDDQSDMKMAGEIFIDLKPDTYEFAGDAPRMTGAEFLALYAPPEE